MKTIVMDKCESAVETFYKQIFDEAWASMEYFGKAIDAMDAEKDSKELTQVKHQSLYQAYAHSKRCIKTIMQVMHKYLSNFNLDDEDIAKMNDLGYNFKFVKDKKGTYITLSND